MVQSKDEKLGRWNVFLKDGCQVEAERARVQSGPVLPSLACGEIWSLESGVSRTRMRCGVEVVVQAAVVLVRVE